LTKIGVKAGTTITVDGSMKVGQPAETVNVQAQVPLVEETASNFSVEVQPQILDQVPIVGRDIQTLAQLLPRMTQSTGPSGSVFGFNSQFGGFPDPTHIVGSGQRGRQPGRSPGKSRRLRKRGPLLSLFIYVICAQLDREAIQPAT
jgi:hypothetical protein